LKTRALSGMFYVLLIVLGTSHFGSDFILKIVNIEIAQKFIFAGIMLVFFIIVMIESCLLMKYDNKLFIFITFLPCFYLLYQFIIPFFREYSYFNQIQDSVYYLKSSLYIVLTILAMITILKFEYELTSVDTSKLIFNVIYIGIPFALVYSIPNQYGHFGSEILFIFVLIWLSDTAAYLIGTRFGKTKIFPTISPNKSLEGLIAGIIATLISGITIEYLNPELIGNYIVVGIIVSVFAPLGDLIASKIKRTFKVKDSSNLIPGHGGFLDRLDSFIICIPFIFFYFVLIK